MIRRLSDIVVLGALFWGVALGLRKIGFWELSGLGEPHGYLEQGFLFLAVFFLLSELLFRPYLAVLEARASQTAGKRKAAEETRVRAEAVIGRYRRAIDEASLRAVREREALAIAAEADERGRIASAKAEANRALSERAEEIGRDEAEARERLKPSVGPLSAEIAERVLSFKEDARRSRPAAHPEG